MDNTRGRHISSQFDEELHTICQKTLSMSHLVERQVGDALDALLRCDVTLAQEVVQRDYQVNSYEVAIDEECTTVLARRQPAGKDLRCIVAVIKTITDLERIGDEARNVAAQVVDLQKNRQYTSYLVEIGHLGKQVLDILQRSIVIFEQMNAGGAAELICEESGLDHTNENINRQLITYMMEDPRAVPQIIELMWAMRALERMGDRACNICNYVIYCVKGELAHSK